MDDIADTIERSGGGPKVIQMGASDFRLWENGLSKKKIRPKLASIRAAKFTRGMSKLQFKQSHSEDSWQTYEFLREDLVIPKNCDKERGIPPDKKRDILRSVGHHMPPSVFFLRRSYIV